MKKTFIIFLLYTSMWGNIAVAEIEPNTENLTETINYLLFFVRLKGGKVISSEAWLLKALEAFREKQN